MGPVLCLVSAACFGAMAVFGKLAFAAGVSPDALLLVRFTLAAAILGIALLLRPAWRRPPAARKHGRAPATGNPLSIGVVLIALALGAVGYATQAGLYFAALRRMDASLLSLVLYTYPLMVTVAAVALGRDRLSPGRIVALAAASGGTLLVLLGAGGGGFDGIGALLALGSAVTYTVYILVADTIVDRISPVLLSALVMAGAAATFATRAAFADATDLGFGVDGWIWLGAIALVSTVVAMLTFFAGLARTGPSAAAILSTFEPVVTTTLATVVLGDFLTPVQLLGGLLVLASVVVLQLRTRRPVTSTAPRAGSGTGTGTRAAISPEPAPCSPARSAGSG